MIKYMFLYDYENVIFVRRCTFNA